MLCFLCLEQPDGVYVYAVAKFATDADRNFANQQRIAAGENGAWFSENITDKPLNFTALPVCILPNEPKRKPSQQNIVTKIETGERKGNTSAHAWVRSGHNRLNQLRQFAYDGRYWFYQPDKRSAFIPASASEIPDAIINDMSEYTGIRPAFLREETPEVQS